MMLPCICDYLLTPFRITKNWLVNRSTPPVIVLIYHRITRLTSDPQLLAVTPENFSNQMLFLKDNFPILRLDEDWTEIDRPSVAITFDDGYADNILEALPILEQYGIPATFFITTGYIGSEREFWWDELERLILCEREFPCFLELDDGHNRRIWPTSSKAMRYRLYREMHTLMRTIAPEQREKVLGCLRLWANTQERGRYSHRVATLDELRRLAQSDIVTIGAHTVAHTPLSILSAELQEKEIMESKRLLEVWLGREISVFSYPFGSCSDYTSDTVALCRAAGFVRAMANIPGRCNCWTDPFQMPRNLVRNWSLGSFKRRIRGFLVA